MFVKNAIAGIVPLAPDDFSTSNHQKICRAIQSERDKGEPFGITTISDASGVHSSDISTLLDDPINDDPGYLVKLAKKLHNLALKRQLFAHGQTLCRSAMNGGDALEIIDRHLGKLEGLREGSGGKDWRAIFHTYEESINAPPVKFAIAGFLQEAGITMIGGLAGHGKTLVMLNMTKSLLTGEPLFNYEPFKVSELSQRVLYLIPECGLGPFVHRLKLFYLLDYVRDERLCYRTLNHKDSMAGLSDPRILGAARGADVFLDTAVRFMEGDENAASDQRQFAQVLFSLLRAGARTITGAHHAPKSLGKADYLSLENVLRGSGDIGAQLATCWAIYQSDPTTNEIVVRNVKPRDFEPCGEFRIQGRPWIDHEGHFQITQMPGFCEPFVPADRGKQRGRPATHEKADKLAAALKLIDGGKTVEEAAASVGVSRRTLFDWKKGQGEYGE
jgi:hypothetical protein